MANADLALTGADFADFFMALWGKTPFPWQQVLAERVLAGGLHAWPAVISLPTAAGKTACLDIALFSLAAQAPRQAPGEPFCVPRRIFFVVDRRLVVDEAFERAREIAAKLAGRNDGILATVAGRLRLLAGGEDERPVACFQLRAGIYRDDAWARSPIQPTIVCSTVDQIGSRLLFRAYGRSFKAWHVLAGLAGNDSLILLDEAHCAGPFKETLDAVAHFRQWAEKPLGLPFQLVVMTAAPPPHVSPFPDPLTEQADRAHPVLAARIGAAKPCRLLVAQKARGNDLGKLNQALADQLVAAAEGLVRLAGEQPQAYRGKPAVAIFCNRVDTARRAHELLAGRHDEHAILLTGRMRPLDKDDTIGDELRVLAAAGAQARELPAPLFVVATQTLEVGADLDFDLMVSECADLSALRQRFGRLNRMGRPISARGLIVVRADQEAEDAPPDPVYGPALTHTWRWLQSQLDDRGEIDLGIAALAARLPADLAPFIAEVAHAPVMLPAHLDALCQTAPVPQPSPDIALFLHGPRSGPADVQVCWRCDLNCDLADDARDIAWSEAVDLCPPASGELMPVPLAALRRWMAGLSPAADHGDLEGIEPEPDSNPGGNSIEVLRWRGRDAARVIADPGAIHPGDIVVIPSRHGGWDRFGHIPASSRKDLGDRAHRNARAAAVLRLTHQNLAEWPQTLGRRILYDLLGEAERRLEDDLERLTEDLREALRALTHAPEPWLAEIAGHLAEQEPRLERCISHHPCGGLVIEGTRRMPPRPGTDVDFVHEDDATASGTVAVPLHSHLLGVRDFARSFSAHLPLRLRQDIQLAALGHDLGKADPRFQTLLNSGNPWIKGPLLAKSATLPQGRAAYRAALATVGYPREARHELLSIRLLESAPELLATAHDRDLVLHLIASHHGHCRPFAPVVVDHDPQTVELELDHPEFAGNRLTASSDTGLERLDSGIGERFWRLVRRYGWWGLAGLEALLILSDHRRSEWEENHAMGVPPRSRT